MRKVTQSDIAKAVGLSTATVALVVGKTDSPLKKRLHSNTVRLIEKKAREMGYFPNRAAQMMRTGRSNLVVFLNFGGYSDSASQRSYHLGRLVLEAGFEYQTIDAYWWVSEGQRILDQVIALRPEGIVVSGSAQTEIDFSRLSEAGICLVSLGIEIPRVPWVRYDAKSAFAELTTHCLRSGARHPALLIRGGKDAGLNWQTRDRRAGFLDALQAAGLETPAEIDLKDLSAINGLRRPAVLYDSNRPPMFKPFHAGAEAAKIIGSVKNRPDALICTNDNYAIGAMTSFLTQGIDIPRDMLLTGFDNVSYTSQGPVPITTMEQPTEQMCLAAMEMLKARLKKPFEISYEERIFPCQIVRRLSAPSLPSKAAKPASRKA